jgi:phage terminase large subunit
MAVHQRRVRWYQADLYRHLVNVEDCRALEIAHRRWGKDETVLGATNERMHNRVGTYWHCLPEYAQARKAIWTAVNANTGKKRIDEAFPVETRAKTLNDEMFIELKNGSTWQCIGSDRYNATVGAGPVFIAYSEWALANPAAWAYHRPMLEENGGGAAFITTPRGKNHAHAMYLRYKKMMAENPRYFAEISTIHDTGALSPAQLEESLSEYIDLFGEDLGQAQFEQEYECSFNAAILGAFYAREMVKVRKEERITAIEPIPGRPVHRAWDIGVRDDTSIWWFQVVGLQIFILDCYTASGAGVDHYAEYVGRILDERGWISGVDWVPHDAANRQWALPGAKTIIQQMGTFGLHPQQCPDATKLNGIAAARKALARCVFDPRCEDIGIAALEQYRREWDDDRKVFKANEVHDWSSHLADAFRYLALSWQEVPRESGMPVMPLAPPPGKVIAPPVHEPANGRIRI